MSANNLSEMDVEKIIDKVFSRKDYKSIEEAYQELAKTMVLYFSTDGTADFVLSRVYHSFNFSLLPSSLQIVAKQTWGENIKPNDKFIVLLGTYGKEEPWQDRHQSKGHKAILLNHETLTKIPMVARLLQQIGFDLGTLLGENKGIEFEGIGGTFGVFYVSPAKDSPYIPAQDFVTNYNVQSVIGTGVMLPHGDISVYIGFSRIPIEKENSSSIAPLMSLFWQHATDLLATKGMFSASA
jgi:hypothetical protein